jgi:nucleoside-diphosphate-sugar epimerase
MKILFTGGSSFTGHWFISELIRAGHEVVATFQRRSDSYEGMRGERTERVSRLCRCVYECSFGDESFLELLEGEKHWDLLCHHAAEVKGYRDPRFDVVGALRKNTANVEPVLRRLRDKGGRRVVLTGSVFENDEGAGSEELEALSPYGLSKGLTAQVFRYFAARLQLRLGKFVISNPFGPFEEPRFTSYLARSWCNGESASVKTPDYVRDNIHVSLLARAYARFVELLPAEPGFERINPSGYAESQGEFATRFASEMRHRLKLECRVDFEKQVDFSEPRARVNTDVLEAGALGWNETEAWDELAAYYLERFGSGDGSEREIPGERVPDAG